jgi:hypothetical protein
MVRWNRRCKCGELPEGEAKGGGVSSIKQRR